ncbi:ATP-binding protein [Nanoarchaeota archaeon]
MDEPQAYKRPGLEDLASELDKKGTKTNGNGSNGGNDETPTVANGSGHGSEGYNVDLPNILNEIGKGYTYESAFKEYFTNSIDEKLRGHVNKDLKVTAIVSRPSQALYIEDNAGGITKKDLMQVGISSEKKYETMSAGYKGLGMQAFRKFADEMIIVSKHKDSDKYLIGTVNKEEAFIATKEATEKEVSNLEEVMLGAGRPIKGSGTRVIFKGVSKRVISDKFAPVKLDSFLARTYAPLLEKGVAKITLGSATAKRDKIEVYPKYLDGETVLDMNISLGKNDKYYFNFKVNHNPGAESENVLDLYSTGVFVQSLSEVEGYKKDEVLGSKKFVGRIDTNLLEKLLDGNRKNVAVDEDHPRFKEFQTLMKDARTTLKKKLKSLRGRRNEEYGDVMDELFNYLTPIANQILSKNVIRFNKKKSEDAPSEEESDDEPKEEDKDIPSTEDKKPDEGKKDKKKRGPTEWKRPNYEFIELGISSTKPQRSLYDKSARNVLINKKHPDFERVVDGNYQSYQAKDYILRLVCKELAWNEFAPLMKKDESKSIEKDVANSLAHHVGEIQEDLYSVASKALIKSMGLEGIVKNTISNNI